SDPWLVTTGLFLSSRRRHTRFSRDWSSDVCSSDLGGVVHRTVDDTPFGGGPGMVMKPEPFFRAMEAIRGEGHNPDRVLLMTPQRSEERRVGKERRARRAA